MGIEHHRKALARTLCVPEYADFSIIALQGLFGTFKGFLHGKILVIASEYAYLLIATHCKGKVSNYINDPMLLKYAVEECFKVGKRRAFIASIRGFPFHISVKRCGNRAYSCVCHITYHEHLASSEKLRNNAHIVLQLLVGFLRVRHFTGRGFQLNNGDWQSVDEYHYVGTFGGFAICNRPLVGNHKRIVVDIVCVDYLDMVATQ